MTKYFKGEPALWQLHQAPLIEGCNVESCCRWQTKLNGWSVIEVVLGLACPVSLLAALYGVGFLWHAVFEFKWTSTY